MKIIDAHTHWLPQEIIENAHFYHKGWGDIEAHVGMMRREGIDAAVLSYPTSDAHRKLGSQQEVARLFNDAIAAVIRRYPQQFFGAAVLPCGTSAEMLTELARATDELGFKAVSIASSYEGVYLDDARFLPLWEQVRRRSLPVFVHSQIVDPIGSERVRDPLLTPVIEYVFDTTISIGRLLMAGVLEEFKEIPFVFAYFGGVTPFLAYRYDATYRMLRGINFVKDLRSDPSAYLKRLYVDTSGDTQKANLEAALALFGAEHILWGSDWPAKKEPAVSVRAIRDLPVGEDQKRGILGGNLAALLCGRGK